MTYRKLSGAVGVVGLAVFSAAGQVGGITEYQTVPESSLLSAPASTTGTKAAPDSSLDFFLTHLGQPSQSVLFDLGERSALRVPSTESGPHLSIEQDPQVTSLLGSFSGASSGSNEAWSLLLGGPGTAAQKSQAQSPLVLTTVPEPSLYSLLALAAIILLSQVRWRRQPVTGEAKPSDELNPRR